MSILKIRKLAKTRNLRLLTENCLGIHVLHEWQCKKCQKVLKIKPSNVRRGTSCRRCKTHAICH